MYKIWGIKVIRLNPGPEAGLAVDAAFNTHPGPAPCAACHVRGQGQCTLRVARDLVQGTPQAVDGSSRRPKDRVCRVLRAGSDPWAVTLIPLC